MPREKYPSDEVDRLMVRFPPGVRDRVVASASKNNRSINSEIISLIEAAFEAEKSHNMSMRALDVLMKDILGKVASDMMREGKSHKEFVDWVHSIPLLGQPVPQEAASQTDEAS